MILNTVPHAAFVKPANTPAFCKSDKERLQRNGCPPRHLSAYGAAINAQSKAFDRNNAARQYMTWFMTNHPAREIPAWGKPVDDVAAYNVVETDAEGLKLLTGPAPKKAAAKRGPSAAQWRKLVERILSCDADAIREARGLVA